MKKVLSTLCAMLLCGAMAIPFASCSKVEVENEQNEEVTIIKELRFNVDVKDATAQDTKVVRTGWENGDKLYVFFKVNNTSHLDAIKYAILTYNSSTLKWDGSCSAGLTDATELGANGTMYAVFFPFGNVAITSDGSGGVTFRTAGNTNEALNDQPIYTYYLSGDASYTVETEGNIGTLEGTFNMQMPDDYVYFFVNKDGADYNSNETYRLSAEGIIPTACSSYKAGSFSETALNAGHTFWGYSYNNAGIAFSGKVDASWASDANHRFYIYCENGGTLSKTFTKALPNHASVNLSLASGWKKNAYRGYEISKGFLIRNTDGSYSLTPGDDPFEIYNYFGKNENKNKVYFQFSFLKGDGELGADGNNINTTSAKLPAGWKIPSACYDSSDWYKIIKNAPTNIITIQNADNSESTIPTDWYGKDMGYAFVRVTKEAKTYFGMVLLRDGSYIPKECGLEHWGTGSAINNISYAQLEALIDAGCCFFSSTGTWVIDSWRYIEDNSNVEGNYMSSTYNSDKWYSMAMSNYSYPHVSASSGSTGSSYVPVRLVKTIE